ncbi:sugar ABC transporter permease [Oenococcus sicerae]|uniref:Maltose/maltodextrin transport system permease protein n=2 Tax=Oenococcus sicerae TaxID=2203724 RepID=A0AAJ1RAE4_9LACO|nr:sugar ABC transporter permease [Oenococcus sicerae]MDN6900185.1 sugar ABC transporter permease [Oenococcus sicerae]
MNVFKRGDSVTRTSYFLMGYSNLYNHQFIKGLFFMFSEMFFIYWFLIYGLRSLLGLISLGKSASGEKYDAKLGSYVAIQGDNSMLILLYGLATVMAIALFIYLYRVNLKSARKIFEYQQQHRPLMTLKDDVSELLDDRLHLLFMSIPMIGILFLTVLPIFYMISVAFTNYDHSHLPPGHLFHWIGLSNFANIFSGDMASTFFPVLSWTLVWAVLATVSSFILGVLLAMLINTKGVKGQKVYRTIFILTMAIPQFISFLIWANMLNNAGLINSILENMGLITQPIPFLTDGLTAKVTVLVVNLWVGMPATMLISTGILQNLSQDQVEAAQIDGASKFQIFKSITFPQILFVMAPSLIQQFIGNINNFNVIFLLTGGGPSNSNFYNAGDTDLLVTWLYNLTLGTQDYNIASVIGILIFIFSAVFSLFMYKKVNKLQGVNG